MTRRAFRLLVLVALLAAPAAAQRENEFWRAARQGDVETVKALLAAGVDVNTKFRYGATALSYASDHGHVEVVRVLLAHGAEVNVKDTFYGATPLGWAVSKGHTEIAGLLLAKGAEGADEFLPRVTAQGNAEMVRVFLAHGKPKPETLSAALASAVGNERTEIVALLEQAGAKMPTPAVALEPVALQELAGTYSAASGVELTYFVKAGHLFGRPTGQPASLHLAQDAGTFRIAGAANIVVSFTREAGAVTGLVLKQGSNETVFERVEEKKP